MARQVLTIAGYAAGFFLPGGPAVWGAIGAAVGSYVDPQQIKGPRLGEAGTQTSAEGVYRPVVFGTAAVQGNIIHRGNHRIVNHTESQGKGSGPEVETQREYWTFAVRICEGAIAGVLRIKEDGKLVYDVRPESEIPEESAAFAERFTLYLGTEDQEPDPDIEAYMGAGNVNAYHGTAYAVFPNYDTTSTRRIPTYEFEVASVATTADVVSVMALGNTLAASPRVAVSPDGLAWPPTTTPRPVNTAIYLAATGDRFIAWNITTAYYTDDDGAAWHAASGGLGGNGGPRFGSAKGDLVLIAGGLGEEIRRSLDRGESFAPVSGSPGVAYLAIGDGKVCGVATSGQAYAGDATGSSWAGPYPTGITTSSGQAALETDDDTFYLGGTIAGVAALATASTAASWAIQTLPVVAAAQVRCIAAGTIDGDAIVVAGTDNGEIYYRVNGGPWLLAADDLGAQCNSVAFNGDRFLMGGGSSGDGVIKQSSDGNNWAAVTQPMAYMVERLACAEPGVPQQAAEPVPLGSIVSALHARAGQLASRYNTAALTDLVDGVVFAGDYTCADAIRTLAGSHFFSGPEFDNGAGYRINYVKFGGPVELTLTENDLISIPDEQTRMDALERPRVLHLHYQSPTVGYAPAKASPQRFSPDVKVVGEVSVQTPVCFGNQDEAWQRADVMLKVAHVEVAGQTKITVPWSFLQLVASNNIGLSLRGQTRRQRIDQVFIGDGVLDLALIADRQSAWTSNLTGVPLPVPTPPPPSIVGLTAGAFLDIPALNDNNDRLLGYVGMTGQTEAWYGAVAQRSLDSGANWAEATRTPPAAVMGVLLDDVGAASQHYTDGTNTVRVRLYRPGDTLESLTDQQFLSEGGAFALSWLDDGVRRWEVMQYRDSDDEGDGVFALTKLLRGRLNTDPAEHLAGSIFVLLDRVIAVDAVTAWLGQELTHRFVSFGASPDGAATQTDTYAGQSQREWPVAHLQLSRPDGNSVAARAVPRHRFGTEDNPVQSQNHKGYLWTATDGVNAASAETGSIAPTYTFDTTGWATPITVTVAQLNRITGAGPAVSEDIA